MRLRLWDLDARRYSFNVYVSTDNINWEQVCDRTFLTKSIQPETSEDDKNEPGETEPGEIQSSREDKKIIVGYSWQVIQFTPRPVCFVKITGTRNTANEVFHLVYFEAPAAVNPDNANLDHQAHQNLEYVSVLPDPDSERIWEDDPQSIMMHKLPLEVSTLSDSEKKSLGC